MGYGTDEEILEELWRTDVGEAAIDDERRLDETMEELIIEGVEIDATLVEEDSLEEELELIKDEIDLCEELADGIVELGVDAFVEGGAEEGKLDRDDDNVVVSEELASDDLELDLVVQDEACIPRVELEEPTRTEDDKLAIVGLELDIAKDELITDDEPAAVDIEVNKATEEELRTTDELAPAVLELERTEEELATVVLELE